MGRFAPLSLVIGGAVVLADPAHAQGRSGTVAGAVVDSGGRPLPLVEAVLTTFAARMLTDSKGRFRFERVPAGDQPLLLRSIGFEPRRLVVGVRADSTVDLGRIVLQRRAQPLPALEVVAAALPTFQPGSLVPLDDETKDVSQFAWFGASMTTDGVYLIPSSYRQPRVNEWTVYRIRPDSSTLPRGYGAACVGNGAYRIVATRITALHGRLEIALLSETGAIWKGTVGPTRVGECLRLARLPVRSRVTAAVGTDSGWAVVTAPTRRSVVSLYRDGGQLRWEKPLADLLGLPASQAAGVTLTGTRSGVIVATLSPPFRWVEVSGAGVPLLRAGGTESSALGDSLRLETGPGWKGFGVFPIPEGYVQTMETAQREVGWHLIYDLQGRLVYRVLRGPLDVIVASRPEVRKVFGFSYLRRLGAGQLFVQRF